MSANTLPIAAALLAGLIAAPAAADTTSEYWDIANRFYLAGQGAPGPRTPDSERASTRVALTMFEAVNAIDRRYQSYLGVAPASPAASQDAAAATAAYKLLSQYYPQNKSSLDEGYVMTMAQIPDSPAKVAGVAIGEQAAAAAAAVGGIDPSVEQPPYRPRTAPGEWIGASLPVLEPYWFGFKPWTMKSLDPLMPPPPAALTSETWRRDYEEVRKLGARASKDRTPYQTLVARYRQGYDLSPMVRYITDRPGRRQVDNARLLALYQMAMDDAVQAMIVAKLHYNFWRPITAIRNGDRDGNDSTPLDPSWTPLLPTPDFPEYPCGHCTAVAVQAEVLKLAGGLPAATPVRISSGMNPNLATQTIKSWDEAVRQVSDSRMLGGVHYRFSNDAGEAIGRNVAAIAARTMLQPLTPAKKR